VHKFFVSIFINLYTFRATMCPLSGETTVFFATLGTCYSVWMTLVCRVGCKCRKNTVVSPDDGHIVARKF